jgi:hypothetical protein
MKYIVQETKTGRFYAWTPGRDGVKSPTYARTKEEARRFDTKKQADARAEKLDGITHGSHIVLEVEE